VVRRRGREVEGGGRLNWTGLVSTKMMERESDSDARDNLNLLREVVFRWKSPAHLPCSALPTFEQ
jgi:hypothetical protein